MNIDTYNKLHSGDILRSPIGPQGRVLYLRLFRKSDCVDGYSAEKFDFYPIDAHFTKNYIHYRKELILQCDLIERPI